MSALEDVLYGDDDDDDLLGEGEGLSRESSLLPETQPQDEDGRVEKRVSPDFYARGCAWRGDGRAGLVFPALLALAKVVCPKEQAPDSNIPRPSSHRGGGGRVLLAPN